MVNAVLIGSRAEFNYFDIDSVRDWDFIVRPNAVKPLLDSFGGKIVEQYPIAANHLIVKIRHGNDIFSIIEIEMAFNGSSGAAILDLLKSTGTENIYEVAPLSLMYVIRESHRYRDSVHFEKNMAKLKTYIEKQYRSRVSEPLKEILALREKETYTRQPIKLNVSKKQFFSNDGVQYIYDHDSIHEVVAIGEKPAYKYISKGEVLTSNELFERSSQSIKDACVIEEAWVIALERGYLPYRKSKRDPHRRKDGVLFDKEYMQGLFKTALRKICTTLTSGTFREYASNNYIRLSETMQHRDYLDNFLFVEQMTDILKEHKA
jgi:uncharacterized protein with GYD domain